MTKKKPALLMVAVDKCVALRRNPQYLTPHQMDALKASIERDGFLAPVLLRRRKRSDTYEVLSGNHRVMAAREIGMKEIPALIADHLDESAAMRVAVNLNTVHGDPNVELLAPFLAEMDNEVLASVHLSESMLAELADFDSKLAERLEALEPADEVNSASNRARVPKSCECPKCGAHHAAAQTSS